MNRVVARKTRSVKRFQGRHRMLLVEYLCGLETSLQAIAKRVSVPAAVDELYYLVYPGPEVRAHSSLQAGA